MKDRARSPVARGHWKQKFYQLPVQLTGPFCTLVKGNSPTEDSASLAPRIRPQASKDETRSNSGAGSGYLRLSGMRIPMRGASD